MKKDVYVTKISQDLGMTKKDVSRVVDAFINELANTISEKNMVVLTNFGTFKKEHVIAKNMFSPVNGSKDVIRSTSSPKNSMRTASPSAAAG